VNVDAIPAELRERPQWVVWRALERQGRITKVPYRADGNGRASSTDPATWATFDQAVAGADALTADGIGYVFSQDDPYFGLDLDGELTQADRAAIVSKLDTYTEESSGATSTAASAGKRSGASPTGTRRRRNASSASASIRCSVSSGGSRAASPSWSSLTGSRPAICRGGT